MRCLCSISLLSFLTATGLAQQALFVPVTGPNAPQGATFMLQSSRGGLWMGGMEAGTEGLTYFDGSRFVMPVADFPKIIVTGMVEDSGGGLWIAANSGVFSVSHGKVDKVLGSAAKWGIVEVAEDVFLTSVAKSEGPPAKVDVVRISKVDGAWRTQRLRERSPVTYFSVDRRGNVLFACPGGYCEWQGDDIGNWREGAELPYRQRAFVAIPSQTGGRFYRDAADCIWRATYPGGVSYQCPVDAKPVELPETFAGELTVPFKELPNGDIVIATMSRITVGRPGHWRVLTPANGYPIPATIVTEHDGTIWISNGNGLFFLSTRMDAEFWTERDGLNGVVWSVLPHDGSVFAASGSDVRVLNADRRSWRRLTGLAASSLFPGPAQSIFAASSTRGVAQLGSKGSILCTSTPVVAWRLAQTTDGQIWMGGSQISQLDLRGNEISIHPAGAPPGDQVYDFAADTSGGLWACSSAGLNHRDATGWHLISKDSGLLDNVCRSLALDANGSVWYGYEALSAFSLIENPASATPRIRHFVAGGEVGTALNNLIYADRRGWLWRGTEDGIYVATLAQAREGRWLYLNRADGLPSRDTNRRSLIEDRDGSMWLGMGTNVVHLSPPSDFLQPNYAPAVFVSGFSWNNGPFRSAESVGEIDRSAAITAHIGSLQRDRRNAMRLRYRVLPGDTAWKLTRDLDVALGKLPWGSHTLEVQARLFTGPWSQTVRQAFSVQKPFWLELPALFSFVLAGGGAAIGTATAYRRRKQRLSAELPGLAEWRMAALSPQNSDAEGSVLDERFKIEGLLARGGFATVFKGHDLLQGKRPCAVKIFRQEFRDKDWMERRFQQEVSALTQICHPNVVRIYGHGTAQNGVPYLAMEFIEGETLRELLNRSQLSRKCIAAYIRQTGSALKEIHAHNVCHRDLKPENLMIRAHAAPGEEIVLIDFSIAIVKDPDETMHGLSRAAGTLLYMAPEQGSGYADASSDIYSLTKILLEMLTGKQVNALLPTASIDLPVHVREFFAQSSFGLSKESVELIGRALEFHPYSRARDASAFADGIARDLEN